MSSSGKPPGITSFGVNVDFRDVECQRQLARSTENDNEVLVNFIQTRGPTVQDDENKPENNFPDLESVSDDDEYDTSDGVTTDGEGPNDGIMIYAYSNRICYPGDDLDSLRTYMDTRFLVYDLKDSRHMIVESERDVLSPEDRVLIETHLLADPTFWIDCWYWIKKGQSLGLTATEIQNLERDRKWASTSMGYPVEERIVTKLQDHALQILERGNVDRFECDKKDVATFLISDYHLGIWLELPSSKTAIPDFDVVHWHTKGVF
ncbi:hypothetical protein M404DRAFT_18300 [Pisolithus tinctorius Marx 270]|uniref:Uncharacterized protein n=1 Tax=Pisolithus tinctorius Marx 270 TaxID=870435 RepID=A0A0C3JY19_PISTI|nr:hypothetical protein M404DRAFT_18300 [Pisolithus tinctorius Marx 270]